MGIVWWRLYFQEFFCITQLKKNELKKLSLPAKNNIVYFGEGSVIFLQHFKCLRWLPVELEMDIQNLVFIWDTYFEEQSKESELNQKKTTELCIKNPEWDTNLNFQENVNKYNKAIEMCAIEIAKFGKIKSIEVEHQIEDAQKYITTKLGELDPTKLINKWRIKFFEECRQSLLKAPIKFSVTTFNLYLIQVISTLHIFAKMWFFLNIFLGFMGRLKIVCFGKNIERVDKKYVLMKRGYVESLEETYMLVFGRSNCL